MIVDLLCPAPGATVVDLGCGHGPALEALLRKEPSLQLLGLDRSAEAVAAVQATWPDVRVEVADLDDPLPIEDGSVDGVLCHNALECLADPVALLDEAARALRPGGRSVWSHTDFDGIVLSGPERLLTRKVLHAYADHPPPWTPRADGQLGRRLVGLIRQSRLQVTEATVHLTTSTELDGDARSRVDEICGALWSGIADLTADEVQEWRKQIDAANRDGTFFFCEPTVVVSATAD